MDDELYQEFITESEESITQLNNSLLDLESNPEDVEAIDDIFRQAHTLKGNFGAMGFDNAATVAHAVEDLLDAVRQDRIEVTHERMDLVFDGMDEILDILHEIEEHGESKRDPSGLVEDIRAAAEPESESPGEEADSETADGAASDATGDDETAAAVDEPVADEAAADENAAGPAESGAVAGSDSPVDEAALELASDVLDLDDPAVADAEQLYHARITLEPGDMKGVDGGLFVGGLPDDLAVVGAEPNLNCIEEGDFDDDFVVFVADAPEATLEATLEDLWKVESVELTDVSELVDDAAATGAAVEAPASEADDAPTAGSVPDSDVDPESAAAAVDAIVGAYTSDGPSTEASDETDEPSAEANDETDEPSAEANDGTDAGEPPADASPSPGETTSVAAESAAVEGPTDTDGVGGSLDDTAEGSGGSDDGAGDSDDGADDSDDGADDSGGSDGPDGTAEGSDDSDGGADESTPSISEVKSVRVDVDQLDELHSMVEQLVTSRIKLRQAVDEDASAGRDTLDELDKISTNLQDTVMDMRLIPLKKVFDKFPRLVRDLAREEEKQVRFSVEGENIELDRTILDEISDPLMHVLRNAVDHGIEAPDEREAAGKSRTGSVELRAEREHDTVVITVEDDGGGIDADAVREKVAAEGVRTREELAEIPDEEVYDFIFHPGLSTNEEITDVSGRGVGMDVVKTTVESLDGSVNVDSALGEGTTISIRLPVSVAIIKVLFVRVGDREFGVPIKYIDEISQETRIQRVDGAEVIVHEETIFPLIRLRDALNIEEPPSGSGMVVRIRPADRQVALQCDGVARQEEVVVTPLQGPLRGTEGISGTAVVGDGNVVPILDVNSLVIPDAGKQARRQWVPPEDGSAEAEEAAD
ncbi:chemotaxis protein CheW [Halobellus sp. GM3]|uniref:chemotaxis protein CheW n=1 Tax=Halobellus sp. GM3 TaxID=3458410 RepID=UPI00403E2D73